MPVTALAASLLGQEQSSRMIVGALSSLLPPARVQEVNMHREFDAEASF
jgi:hypothetical protein